MTKKHIKIIIFNICLIFVNIICLSNGFLGLMTDKSETFKYSIGLTILIMSIISFFYVNYKLINLSEIKHDFNINNLDEPKDYLHTLEFLKSKNKDIFIEEINTAIEQIKRLERKNDSFKEMFFQKFQEESNGDDFGFEAIMNDTNELLFKNMDKLINMITVFDCTEYVSLLSQRHKGHISSEKLDLMKESIDYVKDTIKKNEQILLNEDKLILEMSKIGDNEEDDETNLQRINDIVSSMKELRQTQI